MYICNCISDYSSRFNRYMVECECIPFTYGIWWLPVLIDTWWNVNELQSPTKQPEQLVLIDTWWNVNVLVVVDFV